MFQHMTNHINQNQLVDSDTARALEYNHIFERSHSRHRMRAALPSTISVRAIEISEMIRDGDSNRASKMQRSGCMQSHEGHRHAWDTQTTLDAGAERYISLKTHLLVHSPDNNFGTRRRSDRTCANERKNRHQNEPTSGTEERAR